MEIICNGEKHDVTDGVTVAQLLDDLGLGQRPVAVELNLEICPRARQFDRVLQPGDRLEVVTLVGGG